MDFNFLYCLTLCLPVTNEKLEIVPVNVCCFHLLCESPFVDPQDDEKITALWLLIDTDNQGSIDIEEFTRGMAPMTTELKRMLMIDSWLKKGNHPTDYNVNALREMMCTSDGRLNIHPYKKARKILEDSLQLGDVTFLSFF